jgi:hypothetical protein
MITKFTTFFMYSLTLFITLSAELYENPVGYEIVTITPPHGKPFHVSGVDQDSKGNIYACTRMGDIWKWNGENWLHFAEGLSEPCGILCDIDGSVLVAQRPELTRLIDSNGNNKADRFDVVCNDFNYYDNYHEFHFGPVKDSKGNYYGSLNLGKFREKGIIPNGLSSMGGYRGWIYKVDKNGQFTPFASGTRSPAGLAIDSKDRLFYTDNQGDWVATSKLDYVREGGFYGHPSSLFQKKGYSVNKVLNMTPKELDKIRHLPAVWLPHTEISNSPGNPEFDMSQGKFGPFQGQMFIGDHTNSSIIRVMLEDVQGEVQGAVVKFMQGFQSGVLRLKIDQKGRMWVGQTSRGWPTKGQKFFGMQRVDWNGKTPFEIQNIQLKKEGFLISFTETYDPSSLNLNEIEIESWWYDYQPNYGSPKIDHKTVQASNIIHLNDKKSFLLKLPLEELKVYKIDLTLLKNKLGKRMLNPKVYYTLKKKAL